MGELLKQPVPPETPTKPPDKDLDDLRFRLDRLKGFEVAGLIRKKVVPAGTPSRIEVPAGTPFREQVPSHRNGEDTKIPSSQDSMNTYLQCLRTPNDVGSIQMIKKMWNVANLANTSTNKRVCTVPMIDIQIGNHMIPALFDTGAGASVMSRATAESLEVMVKLSKIVATSCTANQLDVLGESHLDIAFGDKQGQQVFNYRSP